MFERDLRFDVDAWVRSRFAVRNLDGGGGYNQGIRKFQCPFCSDEGGHAWVNIGTGRLYCFHPGCEANGGMNVVEAVRRLDGFRTWTEALVALRREFPVVGPAPLPPLPLPVYEDWCELPGWPLVAMPALSVGASRLEPLRFCRAQWGLNADAVERWGLRYCISGRYAWRVVIPVTMGGRLVAFQARTYRGGEPKYFTSKSGKRGEPGAECGRPASAFLFGVDAVTPGAEVVLVEGAGDVMRLSAVGSSAVPVGCLGTALTEEKVAILVGKVPGRVVVAFDADAQDQSQAAAEYLAQWGMNSAIGVWDGAKDAGAGGVLQVIDMGGGLRGTVQRRLMGHVNV